jgi:hypothetical protein
VDRLVPRPVSIAELEPSGLPPASVETQLRGRLVTLTEHSNRQLERIGDLEEELRAAKVRIEALVELEGQNGPPTNSIDALRRMLGTIREQRELALALAEINPILFWLAYRATPKTYVSRLDKFHEQITEILALEDERIQANEKDGEGS